MITRIIRYSLLLLLCCAGSGITASQEKKTEKKVTQEQKEREEQEQNNSIEAFAAKNPDDFRGQFLKSLSYSLYIIKNIDSYYATKNKITNEEKLVRGFAQDTLQRFVIRALYVIAQANDNLNVVIDEDTFTLIKESLDQYRNKPLDQVVQELVAQSNDYPSTLTSLDQAILRKTHELINLIMGGDLAKISSWLLYNKGKIDLNQVDEFSCPPILYAGLNGRFDIKDELVKYGADVKKADAQGMTFAKLVAPNANVLALSLQKIFLNTKKELIKQGGQGEKAKKAFQKSKAKSQLLVSALETSKKIARSLKESSLCKSFAQHIVTRNLLLYFTESPIMFDAYVAGSKEPNSVQYGFLKDLQEVLEKYKDTAPADIMRDVTVQLKEYKARLGNKDYEKLHDLIIAICSNDISKVKEILKQSQNIINQCDEYGYPPLFYAVGMSNATVVALLLQAGAEANFRSADGLIPLLLSSDKTITTLLKSKEASLDFQNKKGITALMYAAISEKRVEAFKALLVLGANVKIKDYLGNTALDHAIMNYTLDQMAILLCHKDIQTSHLEDHDINGMTPIMKFEQAKCQDIHKAWHNEQLNKLKKFCSFDAKGTDELTPLVAAAKAGSLETVKFLLSKDGISADSKIAAHAIAQEQQAKVSKDQKSNYKNIRKLLEKDSEVQASLKKQQQAQEKKKKTEEKQAAELKQKQEEQAKEQQAQVLKEEEARMQQQKEAKNARQQARNEKAQALQVARYNSKLGETVSAVYKQAVADATKELRQEMQAADRKKAQENHERTLLEKATSTVDTAMMLAQQDLVDERKKEQEQEKKKVQEKLEQTSESIDLEQDTWKKIIRERIKPAIEYYFKYKNIEIGPIEKYVSDSYLADVALRIYQSFLELQQNQNYSYEKAWNKAGIDHLQKLSNYIEAIYKRSSKKEAKDMKKQTLPTIDENATMTPPSEGGPALVQLQQTSK